MLVRHSAVGVFLMAFCLSCFQFGAPTRAMAAPVAIIPASAVMPSLSPAIATNIEKVSFWGRPYPYGYAWSRPRRESCYFRRVAHGHHYRRVYTCRHTLRERY